MKKIIVDKWESLQPNYCNTAILEDENTYYEVKCFDDDLYHKTISPGESVYGWSFFSRKNKTTNYSIYGPLRLRIFDKNGDTTYIKPISIPQELIPSGGAAIKVIHKPSWIK